MKKFLGVSIAAMLAVTPMLAGAAGVAPTAATDVAADNEPFVGVTSNSADQQHIASTAYVKGAYNAAIGAVNAVAATAATKQAQLVNNDPTSAANIGSTVKVTLGPATGAGAATDTELVTAKAIRTAIGDAITAAGGQTAQQVEDAIDTAAGAGLVTDGSGHLSVNGGDGITVDTTNDVVTVNAGNGLTIPASGQTDAGKLLVKAGDGIAVSSNGVAVSLTDKGGLQVDSTDKTLEVVVDGSTITKNSSTGALQVPANVFDTSGAAAAVETKLTTGGGSTGYDINAKTLQIQGSNVATTADVEYTIASTTITVPVYKAWGTDSGTGATNNITAAITTPTYTTTAPTPSQGS